VATLSTAARNAAVDAIVGLVNAGSSADRAFLNLFSANFEAFIGFTFIADSHPAFPAASAGSSTAPAKTAPTAAENPGTLGGFQLVSRDGAVVFTALTGIGDVGSGEDIEMSGGRTVAAGQLYAVGAITITMPEN
jgi:hypothetical protein